MKKLVSVVHFMHYKGVVHRDLKPEVNTLFFKDLEYVDSNVKIFTEFVVHG